MRTQFTIAFLIGIVACGSESPVVSLPAAQHGTSEDPNSGTSAQRVDNTVPEGSSPVDNAPDSGESPAQSGDSGLEAGIPDHDAGDSGVIADPDSGGPPTGVGYLQPCTSGGPACAPGLTCWQTRKIPAAPDNPLPNAENLAPDPRGKFCTSFCNASCPAPSPGCGVDGACVAP